MTDSSLAEQTDIQVSRGRPHPTAALGGGFVGSRSGSAPMPPFEVNTERETNAMRTKKIFGTIGTAALAASLGMVASGTAQALKIDGAG